MVDRDMNTKSSHSGVQGLCNVTLLLLYPQVESIRSSNWAGSVTCLVVEHSRSDVQTPEPRLQEALQFCLVHWELCPVATLS